MVRQDLRTKSQGALVQIFQQGLHLAIGLVPARGEQGEQEIGLAELGAAGVRPDEDLHDVIEPVGIRVVDSV